MQALFAVLFAIHLLTWTPADVWALWGEPPPNVRLTLTDGRAWTNCARVADFCAEITIALSPVWDERTAAHELGHLHHYLYMPLDVGEPRWQAYMDLRGLALFWRTMPWEIYAEDWRVCHTGGQHHFGWAVGEPSPQVCDWIG